MPYQNESVKHFNCGDKWPWCCRGAPFQIPRGKKLQTEDSASHASDVAWIKATFHIHGLHICGFNQPWIKDSGERQQLSLEASKMAQLVKTLAQKV